MKIIKAKRIIDGIGAVFVDYALRIEDSHIQAIQPWQEGQFKDEILDLGDSTLLPGFIDTHLHITLDPGNPKGFYDPNQNPLEIVVRTVGNAQAALRAGITTIGDCGAQNQIIFPVRDAIRRGELIGPRILTSGSPLVPASGHGSEIGRMARGVNEVRDAVRQQAEAGADFIKVMATSGCGEKPGESYYGIEELVAIREEAERYDLIVAAHAHGSQGIHNCVEAGIPRLEHCTFFNGENGFDFDPRVAQAIAEKGIIVSPTNAIDYRRIQQGGKGAPRQELNQIWRRLLDHGVSFAASSDAGVTDMFYDDFALIPEIFVSELGLTPMDALIACTCTAATALGLGTEIGTLEKGKIADLVAVKGNPLENMTALRNIEMVMREGNLVYWTRQINT
jgi:imidazolonepropionase-like amidohydrolase